MMCLSRKGAWLMDLRKPLVGVAGVLAWIVVTIESFKFGSCYVPTWDSGFVTLARTGRVDVFAAVGVLLIAGAFLYLKFKSYFETK